MSSDPEKTPFLTRVVEVFLRGDGEYPILVSENLSSIRRRIFYAANLPSMAKDIFTAKAHSLLPGDQTARESVDEAIALCRSLYAKRGN